jgi:acyl-CoA thioesterase I
MKLRPCALALLLAAALAVPTSAAPLPDSCAAPGDLTRLRGRLPRTALRLVRHEPLTIVAIGSSSTAGSGASAPAMTYPSQLADEIRRRLPGQQVTIVNKGVGGETAIEMAARFDRDVFAERPDLVIWQVGTNSVLQDAPVAPYREVVQNGIDRLRDAGIDVVLMDAQYAPAVLAHPLYRDMERALATIGKEDGVPIFRRFALMRHWIATEQLDFETMLSPDGLHLNDLSYRCVGRLLGGAVVDTALPSLMTSHR